MALVGQLATVATGLHPDGQVMVQGERWQARLAAGTAGAGESVRITAQRGLTLDVEREPSDSAPRA